MTDRPDDWEASAGPDEEPPVIAMSRRTLVLAGVALVIGVALVVVVLPQLGALRSSYDRLSDGDPGWLVLAAVFSLLSFGGYVAVFKGVYVRSGEPAATRIGVAESYQITMAGLAATRLLAAGGAGGVALTAWALRQAGMPARTVADRTVAFLTLTYAVYALGLVLGGLGLWLGVLPGPSPVGVTLVPAVVGILLLAVAGGLVLLPADLERRLAHRATGGGRVPRLVARASAVPATMSGGVRLALGHLRRPEVALLGAVAYWAFNIAILWACFHAFGSPPAAAVLVVAYFVGLVGNLLPLPGGIGGVDGGMIGALVAFDVSGSLALVSVLAYRVLAFWLPTLPGVVAYLQLRRTVARWRAQRPAEGAQGRVTIRSEASQQTPTGSTS